MKKLIILSLIALFNSGLLAQTKADKVDTLKHVTFYSCEKHSDIQKHEPGNCPICGMSLQQSKKEILKAAGTQNYSCPIHIEVTSHVAGNCSKCGKKLTTTTKEQMKAEVTNVYSCPTHSEVSATQQGTCPKCNKRLVKKDTKQ